MEKYLLFKKVKSEKIKVYVRSPKFHFFRLVEIYFSQKVPLL